MENKNYLTVSDALDKYMALSGNTSSSLKMQYIIRAMYIWKDIRNNVLKTTSHKLLNVDKSVLPFRVKLPDCASLFLNVTIKNNCDEYVPLSNWQGIQINPYDNSEVKCSCNSELKNCIESSEKTTETITIQGSPYTKTIKTKVYSNGDIYIETSTPHEKLDANGDNVLDEDRIVIENIIDKKMICNLAVKECGCIDATEKNLETIKSCFCEEVFNACKKSCNDNFKQPNDEYLSQNDSGYFSYSEPDRNIYLYGAIPNQVMVNFQTTGEGEADELIPSYAEMAFFKGIDWLNSRYSQLTNRLEKRQLEDEYKASKSELELSLPRNKINVHDFNNPTKHVFAKW